jgi:hypothetical protein
MTAENTDRELDAALGAWARHDAGDDAQLARILHHADAIALSAPVRSPRPRSKLLGASLPLAMAGGAIAASIAVALMLNPVTIAQAPPPAGTTPPAQQGIQMATAGDPAADAAVGSFALLYTVTEEEEQYL